MVVSERLFWLSLLLVTRLNSVGTRSGRAVCLHMRVDIYGHALEQAAKIVRLVQVARVDAKVAQVLGVAEPAAENCPRTRAQSIVDELEADQNLIFRQLLRHALRDGHVDLGIL